MNNVISKTSASISEENTRPTINNNGGSVNDSSVSSKSM